MISEVYHSAAFWGAAGAFIYACMELLACLMAAKASNDTVVWCVARFIFALLIGMIFAAAFGPWVQGYLHRGGFIELRAISVGLGLSANTLAPLLISALNSRILKTLRGSGT